MGEPKEVKSIGQSRMVDVTRKPETEREAVAKGKIKMNPATLELIRQGKIAKGDVLTVSQTAGILAAKETPHLIPLCHPLLLTNVAIEFDLPRMPISLRLPLLPGAWARPALKWKH